MTKNIKTFSFIMNIVAIVIASLLLIGSTFAWFTDSATSSNNKIKAGTLSIDLQLLDKEQGWISLKDNNDPIFDYENWEPGYTDVKVLKVVNEGSLALKWKAKFVCNEELTELANVIDVYVLTGDDLTYPTSRDLDDYTHVGTVAQFVNSIEETTQGILLANEEAYLAIALKMKADAGNYYQGMDIGAPFDIQILATQLSSESDGFDNSYDADAKYKTSVTTLDALFSAIDNGEDVLLEEQIVIDENVVNYIQTRYPVSTFALGDETEVVNYDAYINGNGITVYRTEALASKPIFDVTAGYTLTLESITVDGGAVWSGEFDDTLERGIENIGITTTANIIAVGTGSHLVLNEGAVIQNNDGANAISLTRNKIGSSLTVNGGEIINNTSTAGAIWNGGAIVLNSGKINGNHATSIGGAIRMLDNNTGNISFTMNGGEMNHNKSNGSGGAIWSGNNASYYLNGGEMAYNEAAIGGGVIWGGTADKYYITGDVKIHHNSAGELGNAFRFADYKYPYLEMTGGHIYSNDANGIDAIYGVNDTMVITGGVIDDNILYTGGVGLTMGKVEMSGIVKYSLSTNHNTAYLALEFNSFKFTVNENESNFSQFNFKPAAGYVYTEGDELKLVCLNEGYETYWDADTSTFRLKTTN